MIIKELNNPKTEEYFKLKDLVLSYNFPWYASPIMAGNHEKLFYVHSMVERPLEDSPVPKISSIYFDDTLTVLNQILKTNNLNISYFLRINLNTTHNFGGGIACGPHVDHEFPHKNLLIYLNKSTGPTVVINSETNKEEIFHPKEDAIIIFEGKHYYYQPNVGERRVVLVATYV